jgi:hypothetical protein
MSYTAYLIFNKDEFEALELISKTYTVNLPDLGQKDIIVTNGNLLGITFEGVYLAINLNSKNPFFKDGYAVFLDEDNDVYLGIEDPA